MPRLSAEKIAELRAILDSAEPDEIEEIAEQAIDIAEGAVETAIEDNEPPEVIEEVIEAEEEAEEFADEVEEFVDESNSEDAREAAGNAIDAAETADDATGEFPSEGDLSPPSGEPAISASIEHSYVAPKSTHWWYRPLGRG